MNKRWAFHASMSVLAVLAFGVACSDETISGPVFGDLEFTPSFENIGNGRSIELTLANASDVSLGPILIGKDALFPTTDPSDLSCDTPTGITVAISPSSIASLAPGAETTIDVTIDTQDVDTEACPPDQYDADLFAAVDGRVLGGATLRFNWDGTPP